MMDKIDISGKYICGLFGKNLKRFRLKAGLSQAALAEESNLTHAFINNIENGKKWISCKTMAQLCCALGVEPHQFFFPVSKQKPEYFDILSAYIDDFSKFVLKNVTDFKNRYL